MKTLCLIVLAGALAVFSLTSMAEADEYYVVKSRSGVLRVVDHKPTGQATVVKGPFKSLEDARKALKDVGGTLGADSK